MSSILPLSSGPFNEWCIFLNRPYPNTLLKKNVVRDKFSSFNEKVNKNEKYIITQYIYDKMTEEEFKIIQLIMYGTSVKLLDCIMMAGEVHKCDSTCSHIITIKEWGHHQCHLIYNLTKYILVYYFDIDGEPLERIKMFHAFINSF